MPAMHDSLNAQFTAVYNGFANFYDILLDAYTAEIQQGGNPDVEGLKKLKSRFIEITNLLRNNSNLTTEMFDGSVIESMNWYSLDSKQLGSLIAELKSIFKILVTKAQSYIL